MKALIIEDEHLPARRLEKLLRELRPGAEVLAVLQTVDESVEWFAANAAPDIVFMDIHLADGLSFSIFEEARVECPIIFTTAYDQYALKTFEVNSVDYLLKPVRREDLERALNKLDFLSNSAAGSPAAVDMADLARLLEQGMQSYKHSFFVTHKDTLIPVQVRDIAYFVLDNRIVTAWSYEGRHYNIDTTLEELARQLDPREFYRANRQYIIARGAIRNIATWFGSRAVVNLTVPSERIIVSRTNVADFKRWVTG
ncbi:MAG: LytTR family DNA-binding domain-containing protein [Alistipes sp.]|nr:LytTR family DNA-binding domain-containing protein [Alistipes sp.]